MEVTNPSYIYRVLPTLSFFLVKIVSWHIPIQNPKSYILNKKKQAALKKVPESTKKYLKKVQKMEGTIQNFSNIEFTFGKDCFLAYYHTESKIINT